MHALLVGSRATMLLEMGAAGPSVDAEPCAAEFHPVRAQRTAECSSSWTDEPTTRRCEAVPEQCSSGPRCGCRKALLEMRATVHATSQTAPAEPVSLWDDDVAACWLLVGRWPLEATRACFRPGPCRLHMHGTHGMHTGSSRIAEPPTSTAPRARPGQAPVPRPRAKGQGLPRLLTAGSRPAERLDPGPRVPPARRPVPSLLRCWLLAAGGRRRATVVSPPSHACHAMQHL